MGTSNDLVSGRVLLLGAHIRTLSTDRTVCLPASFAAETEGSTWVLTRGFSRCVWLMPVAEWEQFSDRVRRLSMDDLSTRSFVRFLFSEARDQQLSESGRICLPQYLCEYARIQREVLFLGLVNRIEIWNPQVFGQAPTAPEVPLLFPKQLLEAYGFETSRLYAHVRLAYKEQFAAYSPRVGADARHLFLCHSSVDKDFVKGLATDLTRQGITVWLDQWEMLPGDSLYDKIQTGIREAGFFGIVLSPNSVQSRWCKRELHSALEEELSRKHVFVIPILYRTCEIPVFLKEKVYVDLRTEHHEEGFLQLLRRFDLGPRSSSD